MDSDEKAEKSYGWKALECRIEIDDPAIYAAITEKIKQAEARMVEGLQREMFTPPSPEEIARAEQYEREQKRLINRLRAWRNKWRWRLSDAWDALRGYGLSEYDD